MLYILLQILKTANVVIPEKQLQDIFEELDTNGDGRLDYKGDDAFLLFFFFFWMTFTIILQSSSCHGNILCLYRATHRVPRMANIIPSRIVDLIPFPQRCYLFGLSLEKVDCHTPVNI